jgi:hypothetical protein
MRERTLVLLVGRVLADKSATFNSYVKVADSRDRAVPTG